MGFEGRLCGVCSKGYSRVGSGYECAECPPLSRNVLRLLGFVVVLFAVMAFLVWKALRRQVGERSQDAAILKIFLDYLQVGAPSPPPVL